MPTELQLTYVGVRVSGVGYLDRTQSSGVWRCLT